MLMRPRGRASSGGGGKTGPANICLLSYTSSHNAATSCRDALIAGGHTVEIVYDSAINVHDFSVYDLVVTSRTENAARAAIAAKLNELNNDGMPLVIGPGMAGVSPGASIELLPTEMGIAGNLAVDNDARDINITQNTHPITSGVATGSHAVFAVNNYMGAVTSGQPYIGTTLASGSSTYTSGCPALIAMEAGTPRLTSGALGARIVFFPTYLISGAYTELHRTLLNQAVEWAI